MSDHLGVVVTGVGDGHSSDCRAHVECDCAKMLATKVALLQVENRRLVEALQSKVVGLYRPPHLDWCAASEVGACSCGADKAGAGAGRARREASDVDR